MFLALIDGVGEGCDFSIGCNKEWHFLEATEHDEAIEELRGFLKIMVEMNVFLNSP